MTTHGSQALPFVTPTRYSQLRRCPLAVSFAQTAGSGHAWRTPAARLGLMCHQVLEHLAATARLRSDIEDAEVDAQWQEVVRRETVSDSTGSPEDWPDYARVRRRLPRVARLAASIAAEVGPDATMVPEASLASQDGVIRGRPDLIVRGTTGTICVDYKTGSVTDPRTAALHDDYAAQLQLYAYLEHETSDLWPSVTAAIPFDGPPIRLPSDPQGATTVAIDARQHLAAYNQRAPGPQPARPSEDSCRFCPYAVRCSAFWASCAQWPLLHAVSGVVTSVERIERGGVTITMDCIQGREAGPAFVSGFPTRPLFARLAFARGPACRQPRSSASLLKGSTMHALGRW
jgi:RecB family exonuclease